MRFARPLGILAAGAVLGAVIHVPMAAAAGKTVTVKPGGPAVAIDLGPGENGVATFAGKKGAVGVAATITDLRQSDSPYDDLCISLQDPSGRSIDSACQDYQDAGTPFAFTASLPLDGKYRVLLTPDQTFAGTISLKVNLPKRVAAKPGGPAVKVDLVPGQSGYATFAGKKGAVGVAATITDRRQYDSPYDDLCIYLQDPSGRTVDSRCQDYQDAGTAFAFTVNLPRDGNYRLWVVPDQTFAGAVSLKVNLPKRVTAKQGGPAVTVGLAPGQSGYATFAGKKGNVGVVATITDLRQYDSPYDDLCVYLVDSKGSTLESACQDYREAGTAFAFTATLPRDGNYRVWAVPDQTFTGTISVKVNR